MFVSAEEEEYSNKPLGCLVLNWIVILSLVTLVKNEEAEEIDDGNGEKVSIDPKIPFLEKYDKYSDPLNVRPTNGPLTLDGGDGNGLAPTVFVKGEWEL